MTDRRSSDVLGGLPHSRPHRRSDKRGTRAPATDGTAQTAETPSAQPQAAGFKPASASRAPTASAKPARKPAARTKAETSKAKSAAGPKSKSAAGPKPKSAAGPKSAGGPRSAAGPKSGPRRTAGTGSRISQPAQPGGTPKTPRANQPDASEQPDILSTAVQAAAELAEIGLTVGARALRSAMSRLPRP